MRDDWRKRLAKRTEEANSDKSSSVRGNENKDSETAVNDSESDQMVKRRTVPNRNLRQHRRPTGVVYQPDEVTR